ncbi:hypothetical protein DERP_002719, partial [Dermatophagoides pteronyssinus]
MTNKQTNIPFTCQSNDEIGKLSRKVVKKKKIDIILRFFCSLFWLHVFFHEKNPHNRLQNDLKHITENKQKFLGSH